MERVKYSYSGRGVDCKRKERRGAIEFSTRIEHQQRGEQREFGRVELERPQQRAGRVELRSEWRELREHAEHRGALAHAHVQVVILARRQAVALRVEQVRQRVKAALQQTRLIVHADRLQTCAPT